jgi:O-antigen ligase
MKNQTILNKYKYQISGENSEMNISGLRLFDRLLIFCYFIYLLIYGDFNLQNKNTSVLGYIIFPLLFLGIVYHILQKGIFLSKSTFYFFLFFFFAYISLIFGHVERELRFDFFKSIVSIGSILLWPLIFFYFSQQRLSLHSIQRIWKFIDFIGVLIAFNCLIPLALYLLNGSIIGELIVSDGKIRSFGFLSDQVGFGLVYFLIKAIYRRNLSLVLLYASAIISTGTRGAIICAFLTSIITWFQLTKKNQPKSRIYFKFLKVIILILLGYYVFFYSIGSIVDLRFNSESIAHTQLQRFAAIKAGINLFLQNPVFGIGYGNFTESVLHNSNLIKYFNAFSSTQDQTRAFANAQNQIIDIAANGGIVCVVAVILFLYFCIKRIRFLIKYSIISGEYRIILIFLIGIVLFNQTSLYLFNFGICSFLIMVLLGLSNAVYSSDLFKINR